MSESLSPRELAVAIGVSESTLKRWANEGRLQVQRTAGGHRRIAYAEAVRFIRESQTPVAKPELMGLPAASEGTQRWMDGSSDEALYEALFKGDTEAARGLVMAVYLTGRSAASLMDGPIRTAMARIGALWEHERDGVFVEHRATDIVMQIVNHLRFMTPTPAADAPVAIGGALSEDPYIVPSLMAATVLQDAGYRAINLGADTPYDAIERAVGHYRPRLVWLSLSVGALSRRHWTQVIELAKREGMRGVTIALGGRGMAARPGDKPAFPPAGHPLPGNVQPVSSMAELSALGRGLLAGREAVAIR